MTAPQAGFPAGQPKDKPMSTPAKPSSTDLTQPIRIRRVEAIRVALPLAKPMLMAGGRACSHVQSTLSYNCSTAERIAASSGLSRSKYDWLKRAPATRSAVSTVDSSTVSKRTLLCMSRK